MEEKELVSHARQGDNAAWAELIRLHQTSVFRLAFLHLGDAADAEDVAQECFIRAYRNFKRFDISRPLRPWLLRIVANLAHNRRRSLGRYWSAISKAAQAQPILLAGPEASNHDPQESLELWSAVKRLPMNMQNLLYLRYFLQIPIEETAEILDVAQGTVKSQTHRALEKLRDLIKEKYPHLWEERK